MRNFLTLWRREALAALRGTLAWSLVGAFAAATGALLLLSLFSAEGTVQTLATLYTRVVALTLPGLTALATMRAFTEERQTGTLETLLTAPVSDAAVVFAKFGAALLLAVLALGVASLGFVLYVETALPPPVYSRTGIAAAMALLLLHAAAWTATGVLTSLWSRHQAIAAVLSLLATVPHSILAAGLAPSVETSGYLDSLSVAHVARGVVDSRPIILCLTALALALFVAVRTLETRRWKL